jgi:arsenite transporter
LLGLSSITVPWNTLLLSVMLYIVARLWRRALLAQGGQDALQKTLARLGPLSLSALLLTLESQDRRRLQRGGGSF